MKTFSWYKILFKWCLYGSVIHWCYLSHAIFHWRVAGFACFILHLWYSYILIHMHAHQTNPHPYARSSQVAQCICIQVLYSAQYFTMNANSGCIYDHHSCSITFVTKGSFIQHTLLFSERHWFSIFQWIVNSFWKPPAKSWGYSFWHFISCFIMNVITYLCWDLS